MREPIHEQGRRWRLQRRPENDPAQQHTELPSWQAMWRQLRCVGWIAACVVFITLTNSSIAENDTPGIDVVRIGAGVTVEEGQVVKDAVAIGGSVTVLGAGRVTGDAVAIGGDVILKGNARVDGDAVAIGGGIIKEAGASVGGDEVAILGGAGGVLDAFKKWGLGGILARGYVAIVLLYLLVVVIIAALGVLLILFLPGPLQMISATMEQHALASGAWGVGSIVASFLLIALTTGSFLGILLAPALLLAVALVGLLGCVGTGLFVGQRAFSASGGSQMKRFLVGMLSLGVIGLVPVVGALVFLVANIFGFGAVLVSRFGRVQPAAAG